MTDKNFGPRSCRDCRHCNVVEEGTALACIWEKHFLPPPVWRARLWGQNAPTMPETTARDCAQYEAKT